MDSWLSDTWRSDLSESLQNARRALLAERNEAGHWEGELSTSALSTATAVVALHCVDPEKHAALISGGLAWLVENQNDDGGWGDTVLSFSNISTTLLCWSALNLDRGEYRSAVRKAEYWIRDYAGSLDPGRIAEVVSARYGKDRTFSVPILMLCAICGRLGPGNSGWRHVIPLPFELAVFPRSWFAALRLPVVSYALPALIAIGNARFRKAPPWGIFRFIRRLAWPRASRILTAIQPGSGGFLEAAPLTSFVTMALAAAGAKDHPVVKNGVAFLTGNVRPDSSWPIDTNLATWVTTLSVKALLSPSLDPVRSATQQGQVADLTLLDRQKIRGWLLGQQYRERHLFTDAPPGGWAWTDLSGGVPDADDTPGALLALKLLADDESFEACREAAELGIGWLLDLQNRDGGIPTFCRGWGALPFDRSSPDLTAHTLRAWHAWRDAMPAPVRERISVATHSALRFLDRRQHRDGSWIPLWFGNQHLRRDEENPTYGTAKVLLALSELEPRMNANEREWIGGMMVKGIRWLRKNQNADGGWGGGGESPGSIEETALAVEALARCGEMEAVKKGIAWLVEATEKGKSFPAQPIGFYFAKLWYFEKLYPVIWATSALACTGTASVPSASENRG